MKITFHVYPQDDDSVNVFENDLQKALKEFEKMRETYDEVHLHIEIEDKDEELIHEDCLMVKGRKKNKKKFIYVIMEDNGLEYDDHWLEFVSATLSKEEADENLEIFSKRVITDSYYKYAYRYYIVYDMKNHKEISTKKQGE